MKRLFDVIVALLALVVLSPLFVAVSAIIVLSMGWPVFYRQVRVGKNGVSFRIYKFRSMVRDADRIGSDLTAGGDRRITTFGKWLRKTKIDELPQLINVLRGEMSIVGPRPEVPRFVVLYDETQKKVLRVRPGLTDPASILYRDEEKELAGFEDIDQAYVETIMPAKIRLNLDYMDQATFGSDLSIILKTVWSLFKRW